MATIFYKTGGSFSALTPQLVTASNLDISSGGAHYAALSTERYMVFTPSDAGNAEGVFLCLSIGAGSVTAKLQEQTSPGTWTDRATATVTHTTMLGSEQTIAATFTWVYIPFISVYAVTTASDTWRIAISGNSSWWYTSSSTYNYALVLANTTSYTSGDNILVNGDITITMDQSVTCNWLSLGNLSTWTWGTAPASSYTLDCEYFSPSRGSTLSVGTALNPVSAASMAIIDINAFDIPVNWAAQGNQRYKFYGAKPANIHTFLNASASALQKNIVTTQDMSSLWSAGDTLVILGAKGTNGYIVDTIASISGTTITMTNNLAADHMAGWAVYNDTKKASCGVWIKKTFGTAGQNLATLQLSGVRSDASVYGSFYTLPSTAAYEAPIFDTVFMSARTGSCGVGALYITHGIGGSYSNIYTYSASWNANLYFHNLINPTMSNVFAASAGVGGNDLSIASVGGTYSYLQSSGSYTTYYIATIANSNGVFSNVKVFAQANRSLSLSGSGMTFTDSDFDNTGTNAVYFSSNCDVTFNNCTFAQNTVCTAAFSGAVYTKVTALAVNCSDFTVDTTAMATFVNSYIKAQTYDNTTNDHRSWWVYGKMQSTGDSLTDTTVHTSGTGKFAVRFEPLSSANNLTWSFDVPTGNIQNKTMTVAVWCKINNANYYSGTYQLPRLTINYDNGTTAYCQAATITDWQLLFVNFTPTTTYGQITVTVSGRTDATSTDAYFYVDDFAVLYPAGYKLDLGGMDLWANALPVTPPIATVLSAKDVWTALTTENYGANTIGNAITTNLDAKVSEAGGAGQIKYIVGGKIPIY